MLRLPLDDRTHLLVLTGAGVSAESGVPTFRGQNGLWENEPVEKVAFPEGFAADPARVWRFYSERRAAARNLAPNAGHRVLAALERELSHRFLLATQNVDGLHRRAGSERLVEMHGQLFSTRCSRCPSAPFADERQYSDGAALPRCGCGALQRPNIVWFGEMLDPKDVERIDSFLARAPRGKLLFLAVGTSGAVYPAAGLVDRARWMGGDTWLVNADPADNGERFHHFIQGKSAEVLPELLGRSPSL